MEPPFLVKIPGVPRPFGSFVKLSEGAFSFPSLIVTDLSGFSLAGVEDSYYGRQEFDEGDYLPTIHEDH